MFLEQLRRCLKILIIVCDSYTITTWNCVHKYAASESVHTDSPFDILICCWSRCLALSLSPSPYPVCFCCPLSHTPHLPLSLSLSFSIPLPLSWSPSLFYLPSYIFHLSLAPSTCHLSVSIYKHWSIKGLQTTHHINSYSWGGSVVLRMRWPFTGLNTCTT